VVDVVVHNLVPDFAQSLRIEHDLALPAVDEGAKYPTLGNFCGDQNAVGLSIEPHPTSKLHCHGSLGRP